MRTCCALLLLAGCNATGNDLTTDMALPDVPCGVELAAPFAFTATKRAGDGVVCVPPSPGRLASWAAVSGDLALLAVQLPAPGKYAFPAPGARVALVLHDGTACDRWSGSVEWTAGSPWRIDLALTCIGQPLELRGVLFGEAGDGGT
jgi:hypothetical protein